MARTAIHPGQHLAEQLKELGMSAAELGRRLKVPTNRITGILNGQRAVTGDSALRLAHFFGTSPELWAGMQLQYDLYQAGKLTRPRIDRLAAMSKSLSHFSSFNFFHFVGTRIKLCTSPVRFIPTFYFPISNR